jgi:hypothetical protein
VPGVDGALVTFKLLPPSKRVQVQGERGFMTLVRPCFFSAAPGLDALPVSVQALSSKFLCCFQLCDL